MSPGEVIFEVIIFILLLVVLGFMLYWAGVALFIALYVTAAIGWIPIFLVWNDPNSRVSLDGDFWETWAALAMIEYGVLIAGWFIVNYFVSVHNGVLPAFLKPVAWLFPHRANDLVRDGNASGKQLMDALEGVGKPLTKAGAILRTYRAGRAAEKFKAEQSYLEAEEELAREAAELERTKVRVKELKKHVHTLKKTR